MYFDVSQKNYGLAARTSAGFFSNVTGVMKKTSDPKLKESLSDWMTRQGSITAALEEGNSTALLNVARTFLMSKKSFGPHHSSTFSEPERQALNCSLD